MAQRELSKQEATRVLNPVAPEKAFYFYAAVDRPLGRSSKSLPEFAEVVGQVDASSVKFHLERGDFENWFRMLGDPVLPEQVAGLRGKTSDPTELRGKVSSEVRSRVDRLQRIAGARGSNSRAPQSVRPLKS